MELDRFQRTVLYNQHLILHQLDPSTGWDRSAEAIYNGYQSDDDHLVPDADLTAADRKEVMDILDMFDALLRAGGTATFLGFDGNHDTARMAFVQFLWNSGRWSRLSSGTANSHSSTLDGYRRGLAVWTQCADRHQLTAADVSAIEAAL